MNGAVYNESYNFGFMTFVGCRNNETQRILHYSTIDDGVMQFEEIIGPVNWSKEGF